MQPKLEEKNGPDAGNLPLVSVVMCTYNGEPFLADQLDSILGQTYPHLELIIVDDASTDNTHPVVEQYRLKDNRIKFYVNEQNLGPNKNFEKAIQLASADYIAISDQDDIWDREKLTIMMRDWRPDALFVFSLSGSFDERGFSFRKPASRVYYSDIRDAHTLVFNTPVNGHACMFKKELIPPTLPFPPDIFYDWWMSMHAVSPGTIGCVPQTLSWQRIHGKNFSRQVHFMPDKKERESRTRNQWIYFIETFFATGRGTEEARQSLLRYASILKKMDGDHFSSAMFWYVLKNRKKIFHYKRKPFVFFSHLKHAIRMARSGVL